jgi:transcriptional regulator with GAF, ATPase, and Fis domain
MSGTESLDELQQLAAATARAREEQLFPALAQFIGGALQVSKAVISRVLDAGHVRTLAVWSRGIAGANYDYPLAGTPCREVLEGRTVHHPAGLEQRFPQTSQGYQGYFGMPLSGARDEILGHLCVYDARALEISPRQRLFCEIVAGRAAGELQRLAAERRMQAQNRYLQEEINAAHDTAEIIGASGGLAKVLDTVRRIASTEAPVLICGETGTGTELIARAIHSASRRAERPFIKLDCAALPAELLESALFGREPDGAPGDVERREGRLELADGGTIFLDEIAELGLAAQARLLRVLEVRDFEPIGSRSTLKVDVRIVAATQRDLRKAVRDGQFREDLHSRLTVCPIELPPLRARAADVPLLVQYFAQKYATRVGRRIEGIDPGTLIALSRYPWPGNVRELKNLVERALILNTAPVLKIPPEMLAVDSAAQHAEVAATATGIYRGPTFSMPPATAEIDDTENTGLHHVQREHILRVLNATHWVIEGNAGAALKLGMKPATLRHRMKKLGIARANPRVPPTT